MVALIAGIAVGVLVVVAVNGARRGRPAPVVAPRAAPASGPPPRPYQAPSSGSAGPPPSAADYGIRVNQPGAPPPPVAPSPASAPAEAPAPAVEPPRPPAADPDVATRVAGAPDLAKQPAPDPVAPAHPARGRLDLQDGSDGLDLGDDPVTIGRGTDQRLRVKDARASRHHATVRRRSKGRSGWEVEDAGSSNGTSLNGHTIPDGRVAPLRDGDRIGIGDTTIVYTEPAAPPTAPPPPSPDDDATRIGP